MTISRGDEKNFAFLAPEQVRMLFENETASVPVELRRVPGAQVLWLNERAATSDPKFLELRGNIEAYKAHLLEACAFSVDGTGTEVALGWADRYGGQGIAACGGSGRAAFVKGYHVKGIGKTPLASPRNDVAHSTGYVFAEEAIRETVYCEIMSEFPWSVVPNLAILTTGLNYTWDKSVNWAGPESEAKVLVVRPPFLRPAHFERAVAAVLPDAKVGAKDAARVRHMIKALTGLAGRESLRDIFLNFWGRWAEQMAHGLVTRLTQHNYSTSNVCLGGQLVDFGAARSFISHRSITARSGIMQHGPELGTLTNSMRLISENLSWYGGELEIDSEITKNIIESYNRKFLRTLLSMVNIPGKILSIISLDKNLNILLREAFKSREFQDCMKHAFMNFNKPESGIKSGPEDMYYIYVERAVSVLFARESVVSLLGCSNVSNIAVKNKTDVKDLFLETVRGDVRDMLSRMPMRSLRGDVVKEFIEGKL